MTINECLHSNARRFEISPSPRDKTWLGMISWRCEAGVFLAPGTEFRKRQNVRSDMRLPRAKVMT